MNCPDIERLLDLALGATIDPETAVHLRGCADCRALMRFVVETEAAFTPPIEVPESLVSATITGVIASGGRAKHDVGRVTPWEAAQTGLLAAVTVLLAGVATESFQAPTVGLTACLLSGLGAAIYEVREGPGTAPR